MTPSLGPHESQFTATELATAAQTAHAHGLKIAAHAHGGQGIADAMAAGVDSIEHCTFFTADGVDADPDVIAELGRRHTVVSVTFGSTPGSTTPYPAIAKRLAAIQANHAALHRAGARIVCGTDAGVGPNKPHDVLRYGVSALPAIGLSNAQALRANTSVAADICGVGDRKGSISAGKDADIIAVPGNPSTTSAASSRYSPCSSRAIESGRPRAARRKRLLLPNSCPPTASRPARPYIALSGHEFVCCEGSFSASDGVARLPFSAGTSGQCHTSGRPVAPRTASTMPAPISVRPAASRMTPRRFTMVLPIIVGSRGR